MKGAPHGPALAFAPELALRLDAFARRTAAALSRREGAGRAPRPGADVEFEGLRPYRAGDDPRAIDWNLLARSDRVFVRTTRRQAGESWAILLDGSASMGIGDPTKLRAAVEAAFGLVALGLRLGAAVAFVPVGGEPRIAPRRVVGPRAFAALRNALEGWRAAGTARLSSRLDARELRGAARLFVIGDLFDEEPGALLAARSARREVSLVQVLAPFELAPDAPGETRVLDPEADRPIELVLDRDAVARYEVALGRWLEDWRRAAARHAVHHAAASSEQPFEERLAGALVR